MSGCTKQDTVSKPELVDFIVNGLKEKGVGMEGEDTREIVERLLYLFDDYNLEGLMPIMIGTDELLDQYFDKYMDN